MNDIDNRIYVHCPLSILYEFFSVLFLVIVYCVKCTITNKMHAEIIFDDIHFSWAECPANNVHHTSTKDDNAFV